jgi:putative transcriptional regulator
MPQPVNAVQRNLLKRLGKKVNAVRKQKKLTLEDVAHRVGKDKQSIHRLEKGDFNPSYLYLIEICKGLEMDITDLLDQKSD